MNCNSNMAGMTSLIFVMCLIFLSLKTINLWSYNGV